MNLRPAFSFAGDFRTPKADRRRGATALEYGILAALVLGAIVLGVRVTGVNLANLFGGFSTTVAGVVSPSAASGGSASGFAPYNTLLKNVSTNTDGGHCTGSNLQTYALSNGTGTVATDGSCVISELTVSQIIAALNSGGAGGTLPTLFSPTNGIVTVPALQGPGTGFTIPAGLDASFAFLTGGAAAGSSFIIGTGNNSLTPANMAGASSACAAEGGSLYVSSSLAYCQNATPYPVDIGTLLANGG